MKMYTEASNAKRAAKTVTDKHPGVLTPTATSAPSGLYFPAATWAKHPTDANPAGEAETALAAELADTLKFVATEADEAPAPKAKPKAAPKKAAKKVAKKAAAPKAKRAKTGERTTKGSTLIAMVSRKNGATVDELTAALDWQKHTVRSWVSSYNSDGREMKPKRAQIATIRGEDGAPTTYKLD